MKTSEKPGAIISLFIGSIAQSYSIIDKTKEHQDL